MVKVPQIYSNQSVPEESGGKNKVSMSWAKLMQEDGGMPPLKSNRRTIFVLLTRTG